jgi:hypothetical protein
LITASPARCRQTAGIETRAFPRERVRSLAQMRCWRYTAACGSKAVKAAILLSRLENGHLPESGRSKWAPEATAFHPLRTLSANAVDSVKKKSGATAR